MKNTILKALVMLFDHCWSSKCSICGARTLLSDSINKLLLYYNLTYRNFYNKCQACESLLLIQCEDGHHSNNLIACASYCVQYERTQAKQTREQDQEQEQNEEHLMPPQLAHVVLVIQLSCGGKGFMSFQGQSKK